jgi:hypothetical protein
MRSSFPLWSDAGILAPKRSRRWSWAAVAGVVGLSGGIGTANVYRQIAADRPSDRDAIAALQTEPAVIAALPQQPQLTQAAATDGLAPPPEIIPRADPRRIAIPDPVASARAEVLPDEPAPATAKETRAPKKKRTRRPDTVEAYMMPDGQPVFLHRPSRSGAGYEQWGYDSWGYAPRPGLRFARPYGFGPPY